MRRPWPRAGEFWRIYYADGSFVQGVGRSRATWVRAPAEGVHSVVLYRAPDPRAPWRNRFRGVEDARTIWTGEDEYRLANWPIKQGELQSDEDYFTIAERVITERPDADS